MNKTSEPEVQRVLRTRAQTRAYYNKIAGVYDLLSERAEQPMREKGLAMLAASEGESILEAGCGTGHCLVTLARAVGAAGEVVGIDLAERMVQRAAETVEEAGLADRVIVKQGDATNLDFSDDRFDGIFLSFVLELFDTPEIPVVLRELRRVLKPGGRLVVVAVSRAGGPDAVVRLFEWTHKHLPQLVDCRPIYLRQAMETAGLAIKQVQIDHMWVPVEIVLGEEPAPAENILT